MEQLLRYLLTYQNYVFLAMFASLAFVAFVNFVHNPYAKQNCQLKRFDKRILQKPSCIVLQVKHLPAEYQRQWRAFVNSGCSRPSTVFEFVKLRKKYLLWFVHFVATATSIAYVVVAIILADTQIFTVQVAFLLSSILVLLLNKLIGEINLTLARRVFGKFLHHLNAVTHLLNGQNHPTEQDLVSLPFCQQDKASTQQNATAPSTEVANKAPTAQPTCISQDVADKTPTTEPLPSPSTPSPSNLQNDDIIQKAVQILKQKGIDNPRTAEEQRRLNVALNNLLQACCKRKA